MAFFSHLDCLHQVATFLDGASLVRLRVVCSFCTSLKSEDTVRYVASMRTLRHEQDLSTLEQIALAESLAELSTEIRFRYREVTLERSSHGPLSKLAALLRRHEGITISVEGHCGLEAPRAMGYQFTRERATAVKEVLVAHGVDDARLKIRAFSNTRPLVWQLGDSAGAANRRVELYVTINGIEVPPRRAVADYAVPPARVGDRRDLARLILGTIIDGDHDDDDDDDDDDDSDQIPPHILLNSDVLLDNIPAYLDHPDAQSDDDEPESSTP